MRFEHLSVERRQQFVRAQHEIRQAQAERRTSEIRAHAQARANGGQPVHMNVHTSDSDHFAAGAQRGLADQRGCPPRYGCRQEHGPGSRTDGRYQVAQGQKKSSNNKDR